MLTGGRVSLAYAAGAAGAVALIGSLFLPWYQVGDLEKLEPQQGVIVFLIGDDSPTGWKALTSLDVVLCVIGVATLAALFAGRRTALLAAAGSMAAAAIALLYRLFDVGYDTARTTVAGSTFDLPLGERYGFFIALGASVVACAGCLAAVLQERRRRTDTVRSF